MPPKTPAKIETKALIRASVLIPMGETQAEIKSIIMKNKRPEEKPKNNPRLLTFRATKNVPEKTEIPIIAMVIGFMADKGMSVLDRISEKIKRSKADKIKEKTTEIIIGLR